MEQEIPTQEPLIHLHRGIWWILEVNTELPVGWSIFSAELTTKLFLDFTSLEGIELTKLDNAYEAVQEKYQEWYSKMPGKLTSAVKPKLYYTLFMLQNRIKTQLKLDTIDADTAEIWRKEKYSNKTTPHLSEFKDGTAFCAERAALAQYFLQNLNIPSVYMSGISYFDDPENSEPHSWIVLYPDTDDAMIWDIARPDNNNLPNLYKNDWPISQAMFQNTENAYIKVSKLWVFEKSQRYFWVSDNPRMLSEEFVPNIVTRVGELLN